MITDGRLPLINRIKPNARHLIIENAIVSDFLTTKTIGIPVLLLTFY